MNDIKEIICTDCGNKTIISYSGWREVGNKKWIIEKSERLCPHCASKRKINMFYNSSKSR